MSKLIKQYVVAQRCPEGGNLLSDEPEKRNVELQFLQRLLSSPAQLESTCHFGRSVATALEDSPAATFARLIDSSSDVQLAEFEREVPVRSDFGPFRGRRE
ncbi:hypothetical protein [Roseateles oligotrophus]|uniref:hypothetical protein n=1 Tax=Roseateles oligotrophus TaxID=1769250 RepID=UPI0021E3B264|nr:hypothetical protein [Roseateles oligotrophus]